MGPGIATPPGLIQSSLQVVVGMRATLWLAHRALFGKVATPLGLYHR
jgi:hypothetical protein